MKILFLLFSAVALLPACLEAQVPQIINYQGRVQTGGVNFNGTGKFKFAINIGTGGSPVNQWTNDGTSGAGTEPTNAVSIPVNNGVYSVLLGDTTLANMTAGIPTVVFNFSNTLYLRVWFDDGVHGSQLLSPDQRIAPTGWSMVSGTVTASGVTTNSIADGAVTGAKIGANVITSAKIANGAVGAAQIANGAVGATQIANNVITGAQIANRGIGEPQLGVNSVTYTQLADNSVHDVTLLDGAVVTTKVANGAITTAKIANGAVTAAKIANFTITGTQLAGAAVGTSEIAAGAVITPTLADGAVTPAKILANSITSGQLAPNSVGFDELQGAAVNDVILASNAVTTLKLADGAVTPAKILANSITSSQLAPNSVGFDELQGASVNSVILAANAVTTSRIANGAVTAAKQAILPAAKVSDQNSIIFVGIPSGPRTTVTYGTTEFDTAGLVTSNTYLTAPIAGIYQVATSVAWDVNSSGNRFVEIYKFPSGGIVSVKTATDSRAAVGADNTYQNVSTLLPMQAGDRVYTAVTQTSGGQVFLQRHNMSMHWVSPGP
jgi:hypothetical protein